jgi:hypothetical protein
VSDSCITYAHTVTEAISFLPAAESPLLLERERRRPRRLRSRSRSRLRLLRLLSRLLLLLLRFFLLPSLLLLRLRFFSLLLLLFLRSLLRLRLWLLPISSGPIGERRGELGCALQCCYGPGNSFAWGRGTTDKL